VQAVFLVALAGHLDDAAFRGADLDAEAVTF
jgi:hypothetical protein